MVEDIYSDYEALTGLIPPMGIVCKTLGIGHLNCRGLLTRDSIQMYPHAGGIHVPGKEAKQWVYLHCQKCKYDASWWKVIRRLERV